MSLMLFDFTCTEGHTTEHLTKSDVKEVKCTECGAISNRIISPVSCKLDHTFPGYHDKWAREHEKAGANNQDN